MLDTVTTAGTRTSPALLNIDKDLFAMTRLTSTRIAEQVFSTFKAAVVAAQTEIKDFGELYNSDESSKVLEQARKSREAEPNGIKPWRHKDDPDWFVLDK